MTSNMPPKPGSIKTSLAPPTPYDGDDELSETPDPRQSPGQPSFSAVNQPPTPTSVSEPQDVVQLTDSKNDDSEEDENTEHDEKYLTVDPVCAGEGPNPCTLQSGDHRKVTSHFFGRNKRVTHQIPEECWVKYCRKHYQRQKYRRPADWFRTQLLLIDTQLNNLEAWGGVLSWQIDVRKKERDMISKENDHLAIHGVLPDVVCRERFLIPHLGKGKTFAQCRDLVDIVEKNCEDSKNYTLPSFEFLPEIDERRNPRPRRGTNRRPARTPVQRSPGLPTTFRLADDGSGRVKQIAIKPRQSSLTGYAASKARVAEKKRSSSNLVGDESTDAASPSPTEMNETLRTIKKRSSSPTNDDDKQATDEHLPRLIKRPLPSSTSNEKEVIDLCANAPRPVKRHRRARSL
ncbi:MAG: hypothetical protein L6R40_005362 [Gallowayella cf. fulva]|nr:MAG: hypothetical protein L6R40_005362 [Xanthomendoza cf. fulva]